MTRGGTRRWWLAGGAAVVGFWLVLLTLVVLRDGTAAPATAPAAATPGPHSADAGFARDMAVHHQQAVEMSFIVRDRTDDEDVRRLAYDIINTQANQRGMLLGWLDGWELPVVSSDPPMAWMGHTHQVEDGALMPGMATDTELEELRQSEGRAAEVRYLELMREHHRAGVTMAQGALDRAQDDDLLRLADSIVSSQQAELDLMADMLAERGAEPSS